MQLGRAPERTKNKISTTKFKAISFEMSTHFWAKQTLRILDFSKCNTFFHLTIFLYIHTQRDNKKTTPPIKKTAPPEESLLLARGDFGDQNEKNLFLYKINYDYYIFTF